MSTLTVTESAPGVNLQAPLARANPVAKMAVSLLISLVLLVSVDPVSAGIMLALELLVLPWCGLGLRTLWRRTWIIPVSAGLAGLTTAVYGVDSGTELLRLGPLEVTTGSVSSGLAITLRMMAIALPGVVLLATTDPTDLADALTQKLRLPERFVLSALAAMRLFGVLAEEWAALTMARRARGIGGGSLVERVKDVGGRLFALLVLAIRRGATLATTMESRGFGAGHRRSWARQSEFHRVDLWLVLGTLLALAVAVTASVSTGAWNVILS